MAAAYIGTSGWVYKHWRGIFYAPGLPPAEYLSFYARHFRTVEINYSFYRLPSRANFVGWRDSTPPGFVFAVKASRYITHMKKLQEPAEPLRRFFASAEGLGEKLGPVLFQFPHTWQKSYQRLETFLEYLPPGRRCAFEFRHPSWLSEDVYQALAKRGAALCIPDHPDLAKDLRLTASFTYVRLHSGRYGIGYTEPELALWARRLGEFLGEGADAYVYFNNDPEGYAVRNAQRLRELVLEMGSYTAF